MRGFLHGSAVIAREQGVRGFFQGFVPTTARQAANSATRFGSYSTLKHLAQGYVAPGEKLGTASTFGLGAIAGLITVYESSRRGNSKGGRADDYLATSRNRWTQSKRGRFFGVLFAGPTLKVG